MTAYKGRSAVIAAAAIAALSIAGCKKSPPANVAENANAAPEASNAMSNAAVPAASTNEGGRQGDPHN